MFRVMFGSRRLFFFMWLSVMTLLFILTISSFDVLTKRRRQPVHEKKQSMFMEIETLLDKKNQKILEESRIATTQLPTTPPERIPDVPSDNSNYNLEYMDVGDVQNADVVRRMYGGFCSIAFDYGDMCPQSYTDIGGYCEYSRDGKRFLCPDMRVKGKLETRQCQLITTRMLRIFDLIARKNKIRYWLYAGTLLGAVRHKGHIPWDTDVDIQMPLEDYIRFFTSVSKQLPKDIFFQNSETDPAMRPSNYRKKRHKLVGIYHANYNPRLRDRSSCYKYCLKRGCNWHDGMMVDMFVHDGPLDGIFPLKEMVFEGFKFPVAKNWKSMLENKYGKDFLQLPKKAKERRPIEAPDPMLSCDDIKLTLEQQSRFE